MEGCSGISSTEYVISGKELYEEGKKLMLHDTLAVVQKAIDLGVDEVIVNDSHANMTNLLVSQFPEKARVIIGSPKPLSMLEGIEGCDIAFFVGYHSPVGSLNAIMDHTYSGASVYNIKVNDIPASEILINALVAGYFNVPVALVSGDDKTVKHASNLLKNVVTVEVKKALSRTSAICLPLSETKALLQKGVEEAINLYRENKDYFKPFKLNPPYKFEIEFVNSQMADAVSIHPDVKRLDGRRVTFQRNDLLEAYNLFRILLIIARNGIF